MNKTELVAMVAEKACMSKKDAGSSRGLHSERDRGRYGKG